MDTSTTKVIGTAPLIHEPWRITRLERLPIRPVLAQPLANNKKAECNTESGPTWVCWRLARHAAVDDLQLKFKLADEGRPSQIPNPTELKIDIVTQLRKWLDV